MKNGKNWKKIPRSATISILYNLRYALTIKESETSMVSGQNLIREFQHGKNRTATLTGVPYYYHYHHYRTSLCCVLMLTL